MEGRSVLPCHLIDTTPGDAPDISPTLAMMIDVNWTGTKLGKLGTGER